VRLIVAGLCWACVAQAAPPAVDPHAGHQMGEAMPAGEATKASVYDLEGMGLVDHTGKKVRLDLFRGQPVLISMFYGTCTTACPLLVAKVKRLETKLSARAKAGTRVVLVSFDPVRDTPASLGKLATVFGIDPRWRLAQAPEDSVRNLAAALGIRYRFLSDGSLNHSSVLTLLDASGTVAARIEGLDAPDDAIVEKLETLTAQKKR
jgi:protein SCO1/2